MKQIAVYAGSFDPITNGHLDIIARASALFDKVIIAILVNQNKKTLFTPQQRANQIKPLIKKFNNVKVDFFDGLLVDYMKKVNAQIIIRGIRTATDFDYESLLAHTNKKLNNNIETIFFLANEKYTFVSSSVVKEAYSLGGKLPNYVPKNIEKVLIKKYKEIKK